jgi:hypothetical protein
MPLRPLLLSALALGVAAGCAKPPASQTEPSNEPGTAAQAPAPQAVQQPPSEPGSGGTVGEAAPSAQPAQEGTAPAAPKESQPAVYFVQISGVRCIAAPCPTHMATPVNDPTGESIQIHELDFSALNLPEARIEALNRQMEQGRLKLEATLSKRVKAGPAGDATVLHAKKVVDGQ